MITWPCLQLREPATNNHSVSTRWPVFSSFSFICLFYPRLCPYPSFFPEYYPYRKFCKFCTAFIPVPGNSVEFCTPVAPYLGYGYTLLEIPGCRYGYGYSIRTLTRNFREFCEFCKTSILVPRTSVSSVRLPYPYPELL